MVHFWEGEGGGCGSYLHKLRQVLKEDFFVDRQFVVSEEDVIVLDFVVCAHAQSVIATIVVAFSDEEQAVFSRYQLVFGFHPRHFTVKPARE